MNYTRLPKAQSQRIVVEKNFAEIQVDEGILINSVRGFWHAQKGYFVKFKLKISTLAGELNVCGCELSTATGGVLRWVSPVAGSSRVLEWDSQFYKSVLQAFERQTWINLIGSSKLMSDTIALPKDDPLAKLLSAARHM